MPKLTKKLLLSEFGMKIRERFYPTEKNDPDTYFLLMQAMDRFKNCDNKKSNSQIRQEIQVCKKYWGCYPYHYFTYNLFRADMEVGDEELKNYIPQYYWYNLFLPHHSNPKFFMIGENKIIIAQFFKALKINQPETLCILLNGCIYSSDMKQLTCSQVKNELYQNNYEKLFVKPADGSGGKGIYIFHKTDHGFVTKEGNFSFNENFLDEIGKKQDYIIQPGVIQDNKIAAIYPKSVNTFRIITENKKGVTRIVCAMLRIGQGQNEVDNISSGGICVNINMHTGALSDFAMSYSGDKFEFHPDTHFAFRNYIIPEWDEIRQFTLESASKLPFLTYLGWDIGLTPDGPVSIEINRVPSIDVMEMISGGLREAFRINDPDYYWKHLGNRAGYIK